MTITQKTNDLNSTNIPQAVQKRSRSKSPQTETPLKEAKKIASKSPPESLKLFDETSFSETLKAVEAKRKAEDEEKKRIEEAEIKEEAVEIPKTAAKTEEELPKGEDGRWSDAPSKEWIQAANVLKGDTNNVPLGPALDGAHHPDNNGPKLDGVAPQTQAGQAVMPSANYISSNHPEGAQQMMQSYEAQFYQSQGVPQPAKPQAPQLMEEQIVQVGPGDFKAELIVPPQVKNDPSLNFVGMMIGPGGYTQKQMEHNTGCNITVRGKGSARNSTPLDPHREMFVLIKAPRRENVAAAYAIVASLLSSKPRRDELRSQQMAMRSARLASSASSYASPSFHLQQMAHAAQAPIANFPAPLQSNRSPFQNAFRATDLGGGKISESIIVPAGKVPAISGPNNSVAEEVAYYSGARIELRDVAGNATLAELLLEGTRDQVASARAKLQAYLNNDPAESQPAATDHVLVPNTVVGLIIGKNGETIKKFMADTACRMKVVPEYLTNPDLTERKILLYGNPSQVASAKYVIGDLVAKHKTTTYSASNSSLTRVEVVSIPCGCIGILIGRGGETIRAMSQRTNCRVQVVQYDENQLFPGGVIQNHDLRHVSLRGDDAALKKAKIEIQAIINEHAHRHGYEGPKLSEDNGDTHLGLQPAQYEKYLEQMKTYFRMDRDKVHAYYRRVMAEIAKEPAEYAAQVKQYLQCAQNTAAFAAQGYAQQPQQPQPFSTFPAHLAANGSRAPVAAPYGQQPQGFYPPQQQPFAQGYPPQQPFAPYGQPPQGPPRW